MIQHIYQTKIYYKDIDQMGIVYYSRYFEYFEESRTEMLNDIGLKYSEIELQGYMMPVIEAHAEYKKGASFEDEIIIRSQVTEMPKTRLTVRYEIKLKNKYELLLKGYTIHVFTNKKGRPIKIPKYIFEIFNSYF